MDDAEQFADGLELFCGATSSAVCRVYARFAGASNAGEIAGTLVGPRCAYAETLPATFTFADRGAGPSLLAECVVSEPNFWTPELPHLYTARVEWRAAGRVVATVERIFGIRPLGAAGGKLVYAGKNWVLRGVRRQAIVAADMPAHVLAWRAAETALVAERPDDALCAAASLHGVLVVALLEAANAGEIRRLVRWPAVGLIALPADSAPDVGASGNAVLAQRVAAGAPLSVPAWAAATLVECGDELAEGFARHPLPILAMRPAVGLADVAAGRAQCDQLQRGLAPRGQLAGYIV